ncbi:DUF1501 domain-containing protein, partial [Akkermansiaceae bacterium]|nr:DUF1501 domain-containing protein [Akkermansiaceae bacterium]
MNCAAIGSTPLLSSILSLHLTGQLAAEESGEDEDYRAIICVFLSGGNDSFNMLTPVSGEARASYEATRREVALPASDYFPLSPILPDGQEIGLHRKMPEIHDLYGEGKAAFICNVGSLIEPTDIASVLAGSANLPRGLYSHSDQSAHWQSTTPEMRNPKSGWGGRLADLIDNLSENNRVSMNVSLAGKNIFQVGQSASELTINSNGVSSLRGWGQASFLPRQNAVESLLDQEYASALERVFATSKKNALELGNEFQEAFTGQESLQTVFDNTNKLSVQLSGVAKTIAARQVLSKKRQTFFVKIGGWDHHGSLAEHPEMLGSLSKAIGEFQLAMQELNVEDKVTLFTASDFGRTLTPNSGGTDHAWGGNQFVVGGAVNAGIYGNYPNLAVGSSLDVGRARLLPTTSVDEYYADLALWMGVSPSDISYVLPNLHRFHDVNLNGAPMGFMG